MRQGQEIGDHIFNLLRGQHGFGAILVEDPVEPFYPVVGGHDCSRMECLWINQAQP